MDDDIICQILSGNDEGDIGETKTGNEEIQSTENKKEEENDSLSKVDKEVK